MTEKKCANPRCPRPGGLFTAKRSDAKTCSEACRAMVSRRKRGAGTPERRERQREGLNKKYTYRQRGQARDELQRLGLVPTEWSEASDDDEPSEPSPQFDNTGKYEWRKKHKDSATWHPADGWWKDEPIANNFTARRDAYLRAEAQRRWSQYSAYPPDQRQWERYQGLPGRDEWLVIDGSPWPAPAVENLRLSVTEHTEGEGMIASDERVALDAERLELIARRLASDAEALAVIAGRLRERFPRNPEGSGCH